MQLLLVLEGGECIDCALKRINILPLVRIINFSFSFIDKLRPVDDLEFGLDLRLGKVYLSINDKNNYLHYPVVVSILWYSATSI